MPRRPPRRLSSALTAGALTAGALAAGAVAAAAPASADPAPANDMRADAQPLPALPASIAVDTTGATREPDDAWYHTVWYSYTPETDRTVTVHAQSANDNTLQVWSDGSRIAADDDTYGYDAMLAFPAAAGKTYLIGYGAYWAGQPGPGTMTVTDQAPAAPVAPVVTRAAGSAHLQWQPPDDHGGAITRYTVRVYHDADLVRTLLLDGTPPSSSAVVDQLTNGLRYTFTVSASNEVGESPESPRSAAVVPATEPLPPLGVTATAGDRSAHVAWTPADDQGSPVTGYTVHVRSGDQEVATVPVAGSASTAEVPELTNGTAYTFTVTATNDVGTSQASAASGVVVPATVPLPPTAVTATAGDGRATVSWTPADDGGSPITGYDVRVSAVGQAPTVVHAPADATSTVVPELHNGTSYTFTVVASNAVGISAPSAASMAVTPAGAPLPPAGVTAVPGDRSATVSWTAAADQGSPVTGYTVHVRSSGQQVAVLQVPGTVTTVTVPDLQDGTAYTFTVTASNAVGASVESGPSPSVVPSRKPAPATAVVAVPWDGRAQVRWTAPATTGTARLTGYRVTATPGTAGVTVAADVTSVFVPGLANGTAYRFTVTALFSDGAAEDSAPSAAVTPSAVQGRYQALGGAKGVLGTALSPERRVSAGSVQDFAGGSLYWSPTTGVVRVQGGVLAHYRALGGPNGLLGFPTSDEADTPGVGARVSTFQRGAVYWSAATGAHEVHGAIALHYRALGGPAGLLGLPTGDERATAVPGGRAGSFRGGEIHWTPTLGAHEVHGAILAAWRSIGAERSWLGVPTSDEFAVGILARSTFTGGTATWDPRTGRTTLTRR